MSATQDQTSTIVVNSEERPLPQENTIPALLRELGVDPQRSGIAVAVNGEVATRAEWGSMRLAAGDRVEIVRPVQGG